jgi:probable HAF family extracellular repeat protein
VVVGYSQAVIGQQTAGEAFRWTQAGGMTGLGFLPGHDRSWATGVSADGSVVVGFSGGWTGNAFRWTQTGGMVDLGYPAGGVWSRAQAVSADGSVVVGDWGTETIWRDGFRWTEADGTVSLGSGGMNYIYDVSADGSVVVGESHTLGAVRWTEADGLVALGDVAEFPNGRARGVSENGSLIVGVYSPPTGGGSAFLWDATNGMRDLTELLIADGVDLAGCDLYSADVSFDGQRIVVIGDGHNPNVPGAGWVAVVPEPSSFALLAMGAFGLAAPVRRRRRSSLPPGGQAA